MSRKCVLLLTDFSRSGYAAHHAVLGMHAFEDLHVVLLVVGPFARSPASASAERFAELMAEAHVSRGATAQVVMTDDDPMRAVRSALSSDGYDLVVAGDNLAGCRDWDDRTDWVLVNGAGRVSHRLDADVARRSRTQPRRPNRGGTVRDRAYGRRRIKAAIG